MRGPEEVMVAVHRRRGSGREFLVLRRVPERLGYWGLVAGGVEAGETPIDAAERELAEEVGFEPESELVELGISLGYELADEPEVVRARFDPTVERVTLHAFAVEVPVGWEPKLDAEHDEYRWCSVEEAVAAMIYESPREALRETARRLERRAGR